jgi:8-oxo-dGTP pyrophosphatase MutT (NUDIX family)
MEKIKGCFVVPIYNGKIMVQERKDGSFGLFGGGKQGNEDDLSCAKREFFEETGIPLVGIRIGTPRVFHSVKIFPYFPDKQLMNVIPNMETKGFSWVFLSDLREMELYGEFGSYLDKFIRSIDSIMAK